MISPASAPLLLKSSLEHIVCPDHFVLTTASEGGQLGSTCQLGSIEQSVFQPGMISPASATQEQPGVHGVP